MGTHRDAFPKISSRPATLTPPVMCITVTYSTHTLVREHNNPRSNFVTRGKMSGSSNQGDPHPSITQWTSRFSIREPSFNLFSAVFPNRPSHCGTVRNTAGLFTSSQKETLSHLSCYIRASWQPLNRALHTFTQTPGTVRPQRTCFFPLKRQ